MGALVLVGGAVGADSLGGIHGGMTLFFSTSFAGRGDERITNVGILLLVFRPIFTYLIPEPEAIGIRFANVSVIKKSSMPTTYT